MKDDLKFRGKYRIPSARLKGYDYGQSGAYFVTICTKNREHFFGEIVDNTMRHSRLGHIACRCWENIPDRFPFVKLGAWVVMPNHVHGVIVVDRQDAANRTCGCTKTHGGTTQNHNPMLYGNLSTVMRWYKGRMTFECRKINSHFAWQTRFYDRVIRENAELARVSKYIIENPQNWETDCYF